ncbi:Zinc finger C2H2-type [Cinara cedri]|uniref:Zinc finger C2H2-type n=1 Tax=Cinara cedri TaxID=506608 RepID=A0A5E4NG96_9HEMI|nr:Zinc finger C2H2-type [Cinara cedri]
MFTCTFAGCVKVFSAKQNLLRHAKTHDGIKFQCALCPKMFTRKDTRAEHIKIIHRDGTVAPLTIIPQARPSNTVAGPSYTAGLWNEHSTVSWTIDKKNDESYTVVCQAIEDTGLYDNKEFHETRKVFNNEDLPLVMRKGVYPYEYTNICGKLEEESLPEKADFYSTLAEEKIKDEEYE